MYRRRTNEYVTQDKYKGREVTDAGFLAALVGFFPDDDDGYRAKIAREYLKRVLVLLDEIRRVETRLFSSSLLLIYEGDYMLEEQQPQQQQQHAALCDVRMIDFAHSYYPPTVEGIDEGYIKGLLNLVGFLQRILDIQ